MNGRFRLGITRDFLRSDGTLGFGDIGLDVLKQDARIQHEFLPDYGPELPPEVAREFDALLVLSPKVTAATLDGCDRLAVIARFGVGYDSVDVEACTRNNVLLTITPTGVRRPVAVSALALLLALTHKILMKDRITREGRWSEKLNYSGMGLTGRTLGVVGLGNIGRELLHIVAPLEMRHLAFDPLVAQEVALAYGADLVSIDELLKKSDFVCICCALTPQTHRLLNAARLSLLKPTALVINVARGPIIDQAALTQALQMGRIGGAALDVFEHEPIDPHDPLLQLDNVLLSPHAICWTDELFRGNGRAACRGIVEVASGRLPHDIVNREVLTRDALKYKLARFS